ncbi:protein disulfide-isomerase-like isoform X1 [Petromyzon marinus]|uniref:protein disulfide-isomerase-like isoform X1 n=1 Tax=Petromyzon marinus TaxID=7757 RepID=UPI003F704147
MTTSSLASLLLLLLAAGANVKAHVPEVEGVLILSQDNFSEALESEGNYLLVAFVSGSCEQCSELPPKLARTVELLRERGAPVRLGSLDGETHATLATEFDVSHYPDFLLFDPGSRAKPRHYHGLWEAEALAKWATRRAGPPAVTVATTAEAQAFVDSDSLVLLGFFKDTESRDLKTFLEIADTYDEVPFGVTSSEEVFAKYGVSSDSIVLFKKFDEGQVVFTEQVEREKLVHFVQLQELPSVVTYSDETFPLLFSGLVNVHILLFANASSEGFPELFEQFKAAAPPFRGKILFVLLNSAVPENDNVLDLFELTDGARLPAIRLVKVNKDMVKHVPSFSDFTTANITSFCQDYLDEHNKPFSKSQEIPKDWNKRPVKVLVGKNFDEFVFDETKNVFVEFYASWCDHCKKLAPVWEQLGVQYKDHDNIVIAKMDAEKNEVAAVHIPGYPKIKYFPAGPGKKIINYTGERTLEAFTRFLESGGQVQSSGGTVSSGGTDGKTEEPSNKTDDLKKEEL